MGSVRLASVAWLAIASLLGACTQDLYVSPKPVEPGAPDPAPPDFGSWLSMDVAPDGERLVIGYYDREQDAVGFAVGTIGSEGITWAHEQVDGYQDPNSGLDSGDRGKFTSMKVAPDGTVWMAYYDADFKSLRYAHRLGGNILGGTPEWVTGEVDAGTGGIPRAGEWASLDLDADGNPVIAYHDEGEGTLKVARLAADQIEGEDNEGYEWTITEVQRGQAWTSTVPDELGEFPTREAKVGQYARLHIEDGVEYIAYYDAAQQRLGLLEGTDGSFNQTFVSDEGLNMGQWPSILIESGTLHIAHHDVTNQRLVVSTRGSGGWVHEFPDSSDYVGADTEIVRRGGEIGVIYFDGQNADVKYTTKSGTSWVNRTIGSEGLAVGFHNEIVEVGGTWYVGSYNYTDRTLFIEPLVD